MSLSNERIEMKIKKKIEFGEWLRGNRLGSGLTAMQVAINLGIHPQSIYNWEKGISPPALNPAQTLALCNRLGVSLEDLAAAFEGHHE